MAIKDTFLPEFDHETGTTRRLLERVPEDRFSWKPHAKSMSLGRLATHLAEIPSYGSVAVTKTEVDFSTRDYRPRELPSRAEILSVFDENVRETRKLLGEITDGELLLTFTLKTDGKAFLSMPRVAVLRSVMMNHMIHHRGQLSVYLRQNDVPLPSIYGPSADEQG